MTRSTIPANPGRLTELADRFWRFRALRLGALWTFTAGDRSPVLTASVKIMIEVPMTTKRGSGRALNPEAPRGAQVEPLTLKP